MFQSQIQIINHTVDLCLVGSRTDQSSRAAHNLHQVIPGSSRVCFCIQLTDVNQIALQNLIVEVIRGLQQTCHSFIKLLVHLVNGVLSCRRSSRNKRFCLSQSGCERRPRLQNVIKLAQFFARFNQVEQVRVIQLHQAGDRILQCQCRIVDLLLKLSIAYKSLGKRQCSLHRIPRIHFVLRSDQGICDSDLCIQFSIIQLDQVGNRILQCQCRSVDLSLKLSIANESFCSNKLRLHSIPRILLVIRSNQSVRQRDLCFQCIIVQLEQISNCILQCKSSLVDVSLIQSAVCSQSFSSSQLSSHSAPRISIVLRLRQSLCICNLIIQLVIVKVQLQLNGDSVRIGHHTIKVSSILKVECKCAFFACQRRIVAKLQRDSHVEIRRTGTRVIEICVLFRT